MQLSVAHCREETFFILTKGWVLKISEPVMAGWIFSNSGILLCTKPYGGVQN